LSISINPNRKKSKPTNSLINKTPEETKIKKKETKWLKPRKLEEISND
jgi:hypothetical protein